VRKPRLPSLRHGISISISIYSPDFAKPLKRALTIFLGNCLAKTGKSRGMTWNKPLAACFARPFQAAAATAASTD